MIGSRGTQLEGVQGTKNAASLFWRSQFQRQSKSAWIRELMASRMPGVAAAFAPGVSGEEAL